MDDYGIDCEGEAEDLISMKWNSVITDFYPFLVFNKVSFAIAGSKAGHRKSNNDIDLINSEMNFVSTIIMQDEYSVSKASPGQTETTAHHQIKPTAVDRQPEKVGLKVTRKDEDSIEDLSSSFESGLNLSTSEKGKEVSKSREDVVKSSPNLDIKKKDAHSVSISERHYDVEKNNSARKSVQVKGQTSRVTVNGDASTSNFDPDNVKEKFQVEKVGGLCETKLKSSLKSAGGKKPRRTVTWADEKINGAGNKDLCEVKEFGDIRKKSESVGNVDVADDEDMLRQASAEACAIALSEASEAVASGDSDATDAGNYCYFYEFSI